MPKEFDMGPRRWSGTVSPCGFSCGISERFQRKSIADSRVDFCRSTAHWKRTLAVIEACNSRIAISRRSRQSTASCGIKDKRHTVQCFDVDLSGEFAVHYFQVFVCAEDWTNGKLERPQRWPRGIGNLRHQHGLQHAHDQPISSSPVINSEKRKVVCAQHNADADMRRRESESTRRLRHQSTSAKLEKLLYRPRGVCRFRPGNHGHQLAPLHAFSRL